MSLYHKISITEIKNSCFWDVAVHIYEIQCLVERGE